MNYNLITQSNNLMLRRVRVAILDWIDSRSESVVNIYTMITLNEFNQISPLLHEIFCLQLQTKTHKRAKTLALLADLAIFCSKLLKFFFFSEVYSSSWREFVFVSSPPISPWCTDWLKTYTSAPWHFTTMRFFVQKCVIDFCATLGSKHFETLRSTQDDDSVLHVVMSVVI